MTKIQLFTSSSRCHELSCNPRSAFAQDFDIPAGGLENALSAYTSQTGFSFSTRIA